MASRRAASSPSSIAPRYGIRGGWRIDDGDLGDIYRVNVKYCRRGRPGIASGGYPLFHDRSVAEPAVDMGVIHGHVIWFMGAAHHGIGFEFRARSQPPSRHPF